MYERVLRYPRAHHGVLTAGWQSQPEEAMPVVQAHRASRPHSVSGAGNNDVLASGSIR